MTLAPVCGNIVRTIHFSLWKETMQTYLLDDGLKLSDIIVTLCSKLLDYILLNSGSIILFDSGSTENVT